MATAAFTIERFMGAGMPVELATLVVNAMTDQALIAVALASLPSSDAGLNTGDLFWNGGFLCKKV